MHFYASIIRCISFLCCIFMHLVHVIHSSALSYVCILNLMHISAFGCMQMRCILMHSDYDAFMCIIVCMHSKRDTFKRILMNADMGWTGCGRANVAPMCHYMSSRSSSDSSPSPSSSTVSSVGWMRVPATMLRGRNASEDVRRANASKCNYTRMQLIEDALEYAYMHLVGNA